MGAGQSSSQSHPPSRALHVLRVAPTSPASQTNIEPFFDFVVGFEGDSLSSQNNIDASELEQIVENHEGRTLNLIVWSSKDQGSRVVPIIPSREWSLLQSEKMEIDSQPSLLGLSMRMCEPEYALDNVWHVLDVLEGSPAESAGLVPYGDWIVGWSGGVLGTEGDFYELVESHVEKPLRVYVYSFDFDTLREVVLVPNRQWGGEGLLGCVFGFGLLHRIPVDRQQEQSPGGQEQFPEYEEQELHAPTSMPGGHHGIGAEYIGQGQSRHSQDSGASQHHHHHDNGLNHNHRRLDGPPSFNKTSFDQETPRRTTLTPTQSLSFGNLMNGTGTATFLSPRAGTPVAILSPPLSRISHINAENDGDDDEERSAVSAEPGSDGYSLASSLTSVD